MFHTFQTTQVTLRSPVHGEESKSRPTGRRISTSNACVECRRRKIRCDGLVPCSQCQWYQHPEACTYAKPAQRIVPSRKLVEKLQTTIEQQQMVLSRILGSKDVESLITLPREELLNIALSQPAAAASSSSPVRSNIQHTTKRSHSRSDGAQSLEALEEAPDHEALDYEDFSTPEKLQNDFDDVNALAIQVDRQSSYIGVSSVNAALKVIFRSAPTARRYLRGQSMEISPPSRSASPAPFSKDPYAMPSQEEGIRLIDNFFERVHPFFPMLDEDTFRQMHLVGSRNDNAWMALVNMVFAIGSVSAGTADNEAHIAYYKRARAHTIPRLESFANPNVEMLQALIMMGGYYLHYLNRPNEADALMGAIFRSASVLGIHREYVASSSTSMTTTISAEATARKKISADVRRRIWWSLFCLDTWASSTTGRPSFGRSSIGVTVREPGNSPENSADPEDIQSLKLLPLIHNTAFCQLATRIQDLLSSSPQIQFETVVSLDAELEKWWHELPTILTTDSEESIPSFLRVPRTVMKWRYHNSRLLLLRPYLLSTALRKRTFEHLSSEEKLIVGRCRAIAATTIESIANECSDDMISGWNGVWLAYQATFVPLVSLFTDTSMPEETERWRSTINTAIDFFSRIRQYAVAADRSRQVISRLLEAAKLVAETEDARKRQEEAMNRVRLVVARREREAQHMQQSAELQHQRLLGRGPCHNNLVVETNSPSHSQSSLDQMMQADIPHSAMGLPNSAMPVGLGMSNVPTTHENIPPGLWQDTLSGGGIAGSMTPQGMPGAFWDEMLWETFTPVAEHPSHNPFSVESYADSPGVGNWSPHASDMGHHPNHSWPGYHQ